MTIKVNGARVKGFPIEIELEEYGEKRVYYVKKSTKPGGGLYMNTQCDMKDVIERLEKEGILR